MLVHYICKVCGATLAATRAQHRFDARLGLNALSPDEYRQVCVADSDTLTVRTYCDDCVGAGWERPGTRALH